MVRILLSCEFGCTNFKAQKPGKRCLAPTGDRLVSQSDGIDSITVLYTEKVRAHRSQVELFASATSQKTVEMMPDALKIKRQDGRTNPLSISLSSRGSECPVDTGCSSYIPLIPYPFFLHSLLISCACATLLLHSLTFVIQLFDPHNLIPWP